MPFGVYNLHPAFTKQAAPADNSDDKLHSVNQRFLYEGPDYEAENAQKNKKPAPKSKPQQRQKMTVRLRPRKVLCSNCKGICNENNENVDVSKKRKLDSDDEAPQESDSSRLQKKYLMGSMLIPKLSRLQPSEISSAIKGASKNSSKGSEKSTKSVKTSCSEVAAPELTFVGVPDSEIDEETKNEQDTSFNSMFSSARTLKICFGEGEGTVVKIPPLSGDFNEDSGVSCDMNKTPTKPESKAAKKAMKKARKQAKKNSALDKKVTNQSPKRIGALSPRNNQSDSTACILEKRHKHKVKHKKKYKMDKKRDENTTKGVDSESVDYFNNIKEHCMNQKLAISVRRLSSNSYERSENDLESDSDEWEEVVPDFPENSHQGVGGSLLNVSPGDIVWGKVGGFPWWPGQVSSVTSKSRAHVAWFASKTSSLVPCDSLSHFLADYNVSVFCVLIYICLGAHFWCKRDYLGHRSKLF